MLFGWKPTDVLTYVLAVVSLSAVAALASFLPPGAPLGSIQWWR